MKDRAYRKIFTRLSARRPIRRLVLFLSFFILAPVIALAVIIISRDAWHTLDVSKIVDTEQTLIVYDADGNVASFLYGSENRVDVSIELLPEYVKNAFIAAEDARFYSHSGFDIIRIFGAAWSDIKAQSYVEGASTITQQLIKLTHLTNEKVMSRKLDEAILAWQLELLYSKDEILEMYLNYVYFGNGCYGIEAAALKYFGVHSYELDLSQSALLAGVLKSPARFSPHLRPDASIGRRGVILDLMVEYEMIGRQEANNAKAEPLVLSQHPAINARGYYIDYALSVSCEYLDCSMTELLTGGYEIQTVMDSNMQNLCTALFESDEFFPYYETESAQGAIVVINSGDGSVTAMLGGRNDDTALAYNRAVRIRRQPGSSIKPILVYAPALEAGYTAASVLLDERISFDDYTPRNANGRYSGWVTMREAVTRSLNIPAVSLFCELGIERCKRFARSVGIEFDDLDTRPALALGGFTYGVSPYQLAGAYAAISNSGVYNEPYAVTEIIGKVGESLYKHQANAQRVMSMGNAFILTSMLQSVAIEGTAKRLGELGIDIAAKTGTVGDDYGNRDVWLAAYNADYSCVVWMGFDDSSDGKTLPASVGGGSYPAELMYNLFSQIYQRSQAPRFITPSSVTYVRLDAFTLRNSHIAVLANSLTPTDEVMGEYFLRGSEPMTSGDYWTTPIPPSDLAVDLQDEYVRISFTPLSADVIYRVYRTDSSGYTVLVASIANSAITQTIIDDASELLGSYEYYVIPVHPSLKIDGRELTGTSSVHVSVWVYP